jgi:hypothetical protein
MQSKAPKAALAEIKDISAEPKPLQKIKTVDNYYLRKEANK